MSRKGDCWDNAVAESFFKFLKTELIYGSKLITKEQIKLDIFDPSKANWRSNTSKSGITKKRRHSALGCKEIEELNNSNMCNNVA